MADMFTLKSLQYNEQQVMKKRGLESFGGTQKFIDSECLRLSASFIPKDQGTLIQSGELNTQLGSGEVKWRTPYSRRWYYMPAEFQEAPVRGNHWFERMKQQYKEQILNGARKLAGAK